MATALKIYLYSIFNTSKPSLAKNQTICVSNTATQLPETLDNFRPLAGSRADLLAVTIAESLSLTRCALTGLFS